MCLNGVLNHYLDVKIAKTRRGLTPWRAWQRQWCEIRRLDNIDYGVELKFRSHKDGNVLNTVKLPRSASVCRTESRTKHYAFGIFNVGAKKPLLYLSGLSESDSQEWMYSIRRLLCIASYIPVGEQMYRVSIVDNHHSRSAGMMGMYGVMRLNKTEVVIADPCTGLPKFTWKWYNFHQFHLQATTRKEDDQKIIVIHTSGEFVSGAGQLYLYAPRGPDLLRQLVYRGNACPPSCLEGCSSNSAMRKCYSRSEGDICGVTSTNTSDSSGGSPILNGGGDHNHDVPTTSGDAIRVSINSDDSGYNSTTTKTNKTDFDLMSKTPGGSEFDDSCQDLTMISDNNRIRSDTLPRNMSGISLGSGVYEEIPDDHHSSNTKESFLNHVYENPFEMIMSERFSVFFTPPPLPPRTLRRPGRLALTLPFKQRSHTLPAQDLTKITQSFQTSSSATTTAHDEYVVMTPSGCVKHHNNNSQTKYTSNSASNLDESEYTPMTPPSAAACSSASVISLTKTVIICNKKTNNYFTDRNLVDAEDDEVIVVTKHDTDDVESDYMCMSGGKQRHNTS